MASAPSLLLCLSQSVPDHRLLPARTTDLIPSPRLLAASIRSSLTSPQSRCVASTLPILSSSISLGRSRTSSILAVPSSQRQLDGPGFQLLLTPAPGAPSRLSQFPAEDSRPGCRCQPRLPDTSHAQLFDSSRASAPTRLRLSSPAAKATSANRLQAPESDRLPLGSRVQRLPQQTPEFGSRLPTSSQLGDAPGFLPWLPAFGAQRPWPRSIPMTPTRAQPMRLRATIGPDLRPWLPRHRIPRPSCHRPRPPGSTPSCRRPSLPTPWLSVFSLLFSSSSQTDGGA